MVRNSDRGSLCLRQQRDEFLARWSARTRLCSGLLYVLGASCAAGFCSCAWERDSCSVLQDKWGDPLWWWNCYLGHVVILCDLAFQTMFCFDGYKVILFYGTVWGAYGKLRKYFCSFGNALRGRMQLKHGNYFGFRWNSNVTWLVRGNLSQRAWRLPLL